MSDGLGPEDPPAEAYSRVTNVERFKPLIPFAEHLLDGLEREFMVTRLEGDEVDKDFDIKGLFRPAVRLLPDDEEAAQLSIAFSSFPGVSVRVGHWYKETLPHCACDACGETAEGLQEELQRLVSSVVSGRLQESLEIPLFGDPWQIHYFWNNSGERSGGRSRINRAEAAELLKVSSGRKNVEYAPWPKRTASA
jgi:hypothetical protein